MTYDVHAHGVPPGLLDALARDDGQCGVRVAEEAGTRRIEVAGRPVGGLRTDLLDTPARLAAMDRAGVDTQLISTWIGLTAYTLPAGQGLCYARLFNDALAALVAEHPDRFAGLATVPLQAPPQAADELRRAVTELGMAGVEIATTVDGRELDDPDLEPFWVTAAELRCLVLIHPDQVLPGRSRPRYVLNNFVGNAAETTIAVTHLLFAGILERHPDLRLCLVHGGGYLPWQAGRLDHGWHAEPRLTERHLTRPPSAYLRRLYYDTVTHSAAALRFLIDFAGAQRVVLGSDYPFEMGDHMPVASLDTVPGLSAEDRQLICEGNVRRLLSEIRRG